MFPTAAMLKDEIPNVNAPTKAQGSSLEESITIALFLPIPKLTFLALSPYLHVNYSFPTCKLPG